MEWRGCARDRSAADSDSGLTGHLFGAGQSAASQCGPAPANRNPALEFHSVLFVSRYSVLGEDIACPLCGDGTMDGFGIHSWTCATAQATRGHYKVRDEVLPLEAPPAEAAELGEVAVVDFEVGA